MNNCQAGHTTHQTKEVETEVGVLTIFDWEQYAGFKGYCPGQDDVSKTLDLYGVWDKDQGELLKTLLTKGNKEGIFIDVGAHVGYFSRLALNEGYIVHSFEGESEMNRLLEINAKTAVKHDVWFDEKSGKVQGPPLIHVTAMKIDIEGNEKFAIKYFEDVINAGLVDNILMEVSPCFNSGYPKLINDLVAVGYKVKEINGKKFDFDYSFNQKDLWLHL